MQGVRRSASFFFKLFRGLCLATGVLALNNPRLSPIGDKRADYKEYYACDQYY